MGQSGNKKIHQWANVPKSILVNRNQRKRWRRGEGGDKGGTTTDSLLLLTPTHLLSHWPPRLSSHSGVRRSSANSFLVLFHWSILTHSGERIKRCVPCRIHNPPFTAFKGNDEGMKIWKCSSQGSVKEAISIMPMSISHVEENNIFLWCSSTRSSSDSTPAGACREARTDWGSIKLLRRLTFFFFSKLYLVYTPGVRNRSYSKSLDWLISIFIYHELFVGIKFGGCPR